MNQEIAKKSVIYARVSSEKQAEEQTINSQIAELKKAVETNGDILVKEYIDDGYSGELLWERPGLNELRNDASLGLWEKVYILSPDRLARKHHYGAIIIEELNKHDIEVNFLNRPIGSSIEDHLLFNIQSVFADYEKQKMLDRMMRGKIFKAKSGIVVGNTPPFGYRYVKNDESRNGKYEIVDSEAKIVRLIFDLYTSGKCKGMGTLIKELYRRGIKPRKGSEKWATSSIARILRNETYTGITYWRKGRSIEPKNPVNLQTRRFKNTKRISRPKEDWISIQVPSILDKEIFNKAEQIILRNRVMSSRNTRNRYLFRGLITCGECNSHLYSNTFHDRRYYLCCNRRKRYPLPATCRQGNFSAEKIEKTIWGNLVKILGKPGVLEAKIRQEQNKNKSSISMGENKLESIGKKIASLEIQRKRIIDAYKEGLFKIERFKEETIKLNGEENQLLNEKALIEKAVDDFNPEENIADVIQRVSTAIKELKNSDPEKQQKMVDLIIDKITVKDIEAEIFCNLPRSIGSNVFVSTVSRSRERNTSIPFRFKVKIR